MIPRLQQPIYPAQIFKLPNPEKTEKFYAYAEGKPTNGGNHFPLDSTTNQRHNNQGIGKSSASNSLVSLASR